MAKAELLMPFILKWEGGYSNHPLDKGGPTNKGVTIETFRHFFGANKTAADLKRMTDEQWFNIFKKGFWDRWHADEIECQAIANILVDWVWASGKWGITIPQDILGVEADGIVGNKTIVAINSSSPLPLFGSIKDARLKFVKRIVSAHPSQKVFLKGWIKRIESITY
jgi:lysozyme family protein